jgi:hypothetical protein
LQELPDFRFIRLANLDFETGVRALPLEEDEDLQEAVSVVGVGTRLVAFFC